jgi:hypothetical protein
LEKAEIDQEGGMKKFTVKSQTSFSLFIPLLKGTRGKDNQNNIGKIAVLFIKLFVSLSLFAQFNVEKLWETKNALKIPESIVYDETNDCLYVSNINGNSGQEDRNGFISKISLDGEILKLKWIKGLDAPKGSTIWNGKLYVSDLNDLVIIDISKHKITKKIHLEDAVFLNDVDDDEKGNIYLSDSSGKHSAIYKFDGKKAEIWLNSKKVNRPNGLFYSNENLFVGNGGTGQILAVDINDKSVSIVAEVGSGIDGLVKINEDSFIVSDWAGKTSLITGENMIVELINTTADNINSADLCFIHSQNLLIIPTFKNNTISAYRLVGAIHESPKKE